MPRWPLLFLALVTPASGQAPPAAGQLPPAQTRVFDGWTATCDNLKSCVAIATAQDDLFYVRVARAAGVDAPPSVKIVLAAQEPQKGAAPAFRLTFVNGDARLNMHPYGASPAEDDPSVLSAEIAPGEPSAAFVTTVADATSLDYAVLAARGSLDMKGFAAAMRYIDAAQGRQGTPTALVSRGMTPIGQVPPPPAAPQVVAAPAGSVKPLDTPLVSEALTGRASTAGDPEVVKDQSQVQAWRLGENLVLVALPCTQGAYNIASALFLEKADGSNPKSLALPRPVPLEADQAANVVTNFGFDPKTMQLASLDKSRGLGDCGVAATWLWDGQAFALLKAAGLDACPGALPEDWPSLYSAARK